MHLRNFLLISFSLLIKSLCFVPAVFAVKVSSPPRYIYKDAISETVYIETEKHKWKVAVDIIRPKESNEGLKVPVILKAGPYYLHSKKYDESGKPILYPKFYDNYFVPRGYAVVLVDVVGTNRSEGFPSIGGHLDINGVKVVIDWLNNRQLAFDKNGIEQKATWTNGKVGMIGGSYSGAMAIGTAATGVDGLVTIVPIAAISSWYKWIWKNGSRYGFTSMKYLYQLITPCYTENEDIYCNEKNPIYENNPFWEERDYIREMSKFKASVFLIHGLHDYNVEMTHPYGLWKKLLDNNIPCKLWLAQSEHNCPFNFRREVFLQTLQRWFDFWLMDINTNIMNDPSVSIERGEDRWENYKDWPDTKANYKDFFLGLCDNEDRELSTQPPQEAFSTTTMNDPQEICWISKELTDSLRLSGAAKISLVLKTNQADMDIGVFLIEYGKNTIFQSIDPLNEEETVGEGSEHDQNRFSKFVTKWNEVDLNRVTFSVFNIGHMLAINNNNTLKPDEWNNIELQMIPTDHVLKKGNRLGIMVIFYKMKEKAAITLDLSKTKIALPLVAYPSPQ